MSRAAAVSHGGAATPNSVLAALRRAIRQSPATVTAGRPADRVDWVGAAVDEARARLDEERVQEIRGQIADGTYVTEDKIAVVVERLSKVLSMEAGGEE